MTMWKNINVGKMLTYLTNLFVFNNTPEDSHVTTLRTDVFSNIIWTDVWGDTFNVDISVICTQSSNCERSIWSSLADAHDTIGVFGPDDLKATFFWEDMSVTFKPRLRFPRTSGTTLWTTFEGVKFGREKFSPIEFLFSSSSAVQNVSAHSKNHGHDCRILRGHVSKCDASKIQILLDLSTHAAKYCGKLCSRIVPFATNSHRKYLQQISIRRS